MSDPPSTQPDRTNFSSSSSSHRLPTISAAAALASLESEKASVLSTGLPLLDAQLGGTGTSNGTHDGSSGGLVRGKVYEVYGPPGCGKTALGLQVATSALVQGANVAWIDTAHPLAAGRLCEVLTAATTEAAETSAGLQTVSSNDASPDDRVQDSLRRLTHVRCPTLPHLLALLSPADFSPFPTEGTALVVLDTASSLLPSSIYTTKALSQTQTLTPAARRSATRSAVVHAASQLAARRRVAVLLLCNARTVRLPRGESAGMGLASALGGDERVNSPWINPAQGGSWKEKLAARMVLFRDFYVQPSDSSLSLSTSPPSRRAGQPGSQDEPARPRPASFIALLPSSPVISTSARSIVPFAINSQGIHALELPLSETPAHAQPLQRPNTKPTTGNHTSLTSPISAPTSAQVSAPAIATARQAFAQPSQPSSMKESLPQRIPQRKGSINEEGKDDKELPHGESQDQRSRQHQRKRKRDDAVADSEDEEASDFDFDETFDWAELEVEADPLGAALGAGDEGAGI